MTYDDRRSLGQYDGQSRRYPPQDPPPRPRQAYDPYADAQGQRGYAPPSYDRHEAYQERQAWGYEAPPREQPYQETPTNDGGYGYEQHGGYASAASYDAYQEPTYDGQAYAPYEQGHGGYQSYPQESGYQGAGYDAQGYDYEQGYASQGDYQETAYDAQGYAYDGQDPYAGQGYDDPYGYDGYEHQPAPFLTPMRIKQLALIAGIVLVLILCIYALSKIFGGGTSPDESLPSVTHVIQTTVPSAAPTQQEAVASTPALTTEATEAPTEVVYERYTVRAGDSLWSIIDSYYGVYNDRYLDLVLNANPRIGDDLYITEGWELNLPPPPADE